MGNNDLILLNTTLDNLKEGLDGTFDDSTLFESFVFEQVLKNYEMTLEEFEAGRTDDHDDGGIDGVFILVDGQNISEDTNIAEFKAKSPHVVLYIIQAKQNAGFGDKPIDRLVATTADILSLDKNEDELERAYNAALTRRTLLFQHVFKTLAHKHPHVSVEFVYACKGDTDEINNKVKHRGEILKQEVGKLLTGADINIRFIGAKELVEMARKEKSYTLQLRFLEAYLSRENNDYIVLAGLDDYYRFVIDEENNLRRYIFESNVRDYHGLNVDVNKDIRGTLEQLDAMDFWWLNNGITVLASKASIAGKVISLDNVRIVNGLQTTNILYSYFKERGIDAENNRPTKRAVLVRIIATTDKYATDKIIKATNFQTAIPAGQLRATETIHRNIEEYFLANDLYYDRRQNYYKNIGKPRDKIVSIIYLAQAVMAIVLKEPNNARARPTSLIKQDEDYHRVFDENRDLSTFLLCVQLMKKVERVARMQYGRDEYYSISNYRFHAGVAAIALYLGKRLFNEKDIERLDINDISDMHVGAAIALTLETGRAFIDEKAWKPDRITKSKEFVGALFAALPASRIG
ncbi:MAG: AIPR family protein [candidate division Zixibacteria bacterium]|nr:AIPR family protein [candidate division Zixibacteria bacterium]